MLIDKLNIILNSNDEFSPKYIMNFPDAAASGSDIHIYFSL